LVFGFWRPAFRTIGSLRNSYVHLLNLNKIICMHAISVPSIPFREQHFARAYKEKKTLAAFPSIQ
jgi:hypothetical protein